MNKQGYPEEVFIVGKENMCRGDYHKNGKCCLIGWVNANFPISDGYNGKRNYDSYNQTQANINARTILQDLIDPLISKDSYEIIEEFNDDYSKKLKLNLDFLARLYNTMLDRIGYVVPKKYQLTKKELCPKSKS